MNSNNSSKKTPNISQTSILSFFGITNSNPSQKKNENLTSTKKRTHLEMQNENKIFHNENPASKKKKNDIVVINDSSDSEFVIDNYEYDEKENTSKTLNINNIQTPTFSNLKKKKKLKKKNNIINDDEQMDVIDENINNSINLDNYNKNFLEQQLNNNPHIFDNNLNKNFHTENFNEIEKNIENYEKNENKIKTTIKKTPSNFKKNKKTKSLNSSFSDFSDNLSSISIEEALNREELFKNPENGLPEFLQSGNIRDKFGNKEDSPKYDPTTLFVPEDYIKKQTPSMQQFWNFKKDNFDKVLFFKLGKFYELFFDDAIIGNQILELNWMGNDPKKLHVGFPEKILEEKANKLINEGFKVAVIEQMETPEQLKERNLTSGKKKETCVKRELCNVFTKGTYYKDDFNSQKKENNKNNNNKNKFCICLVLNDQNNNNESNTQSENNFMSQNNNLFNYNNYNKIYEWGICIFDVTTLKFYLGKITEDFNLNSDTENFNKLKTILYNLSPDEIILIRNNLPLNVLNFIKNLSCHPQINFLKNSYSFNELNILCQKYFNDDFEKWDKIILNLFSNEKANHSICLSFYLTLIYLEKILLAKECVPIAKFFSYEGDITINPKKRMILDYQTIINLEILETKFDPKNPEIGSLIEFLNKCCTPFGKRLMRNWILNPLNDVDSINERLNIVDEFIQNEELITKIRTNLLKWPDIERQCNKFFKISLNNNSKAVYFEDVGKNRLNEFFNLINFLINSCNLFEQIKTIIDDGKIKCKHLLEKINNIPNLQQNLFDLKENYHIVETKDEKGNSITQIESKPGVYLQYDNAKNEKNEILLEFDNILAREKKKLKCAAIQYNHTKNFKYELEIPEEIIKKNKQDNYILTTSKKGYLRYHTPEILENIKKLEECSEKIKDLANNLNNVLFENFYSKHEILTNYIESVAEIDCLSNLAFISSFDRENFSRPEFIDIKSNENVPFISLKDSIHPCLYSRSSFFVPNDIVIGKEKKSLIVITGPNMGGKSTLLRQVCVTAIIAQIGCYVPAKECKMTLVDRIFTRIGASDKLFEGKSTFYVEMEETKNILQNATINSLVIMDELGRGTSTNDGKIIAKTVLFIIENNIKCRTLFTTHYHDIIDWCKNQNGIDLFFMDSNVDDKSKDITFLYKFKRGICPESFGISVAKLAGLPEEIISLAREISEKNKNKRE